MNRASSSFSILFGTERFRRHCRYSRSPSGPGLKLGKFRFTLLPFRKPRPSCFSPCAEPLSESSSLIASGCTCSGIDSLVMSTSLAELLVSCRLTSSPVSESFSFWGWDWKFFRAKDYFILDLKKGYVRIFLVYLACGRECLRGESWHSVAR